MTPVRLNLFQKTLRLWDTFHPYNAGQAMELVGDFTTTAVADAFNAAIHDLGLGRFVCDGRTYTVEPVASPADFDDGDADLGVHMSAEMNRPFDARSSFPFRPFHLRRGGRQDGRHFVGLTYQHWVADSVSVRLLMRRWLERLLGDAGASPVRWPTTGMLGAFGPTASGWSVLAQTASLLGYASRMKRMRRAEPQDDMNVSVFVRTPPDGLIDSVRIRARARGCTVGDVFLAAAAEACDVHGPTRPTPRRPDLCLGTIVDLRARGTRVPANTFGLYLGFTMTAFAAAEVADFDRLLARTVRERRTSTARKSAEASQLNIAAGSLISRRRSPADVREFYRKRFPLAGGLSSVNMTPGWAGGHAPAPLAAYHRISPTGPQLPLALTPTTLGRALRITCTYRAALMERPQAEALVTTFVDRLTRFAG